MKVSFVYISLSGNTESFVRRLSDYLLEVHPGLEIEKVLFCLPIWRVEMVLTMAMWKF